MEGEELSRLFGLETDNLAAREIARARKRGITTSQTGQHNPLSTVGGENNVHGRDSALKTVVGNHVVPYDSSSITAKRAGNEIASIKDSVTQELNELGRKGISAATHDRLEERLEWVFEQHKIIGPGRRTVHIEFKSLLNEVENDLYQHHMGLIGEDPHTLAVMIGMSISDRKTQLEGWQYDISLLNDDIDKHLGANSFVSGVLKKWLYRKLY